ncbi:integrase core domain-containing protein, partial [Parabacteroides distasonis]
HEIIGWVLSDSLVASNTVTALDMGISHVSPLGFDGLIHHSDRGVQYCCNQYIDRLQAIKATISMTEDYKPTDNAIAERVNGIIKQEWLYRMKRPPDV